MGEDPYRCSSSLFYVSVIVFIQVKGTCFNRFSKGRWLFRGISWAWFHPPERLYPRGAWFTCVFSEQTSPKHAVDSTIKACSPSSIDSAITVSGLPSSTEHGRQTNDRVADHAVAHKWSRFLGTLFGAPPRRTVLQHYPIGPRRIFRPRFRHLAFFP